MRIIVFHFFRFRRELHLNLLDPNSKEHQEGLANPFKKESCVKKVLRLTLLYYFVFATIDPSTEGYTPESDLEYDPRKTFEEKVLPILQGSDESQKASKMRGIKRGLEEYQASNKIEKLKKMLLTILNKKQILQSRSYPTHISLKRVILEEDFSKISKDSTFFQSVLRENNPKAALKYISVDSANVNATSLCTLTANIQISEIQYFSTDDSQSFSMEYDLRNVYTIPVLLAAKEKRSTKISDDNFQKDKLLVFNYEPQRLRERLFNQLESPEAFVYQVTFALLAYISLKVLLNASKRRLFIPILRLHLANKEDASPEEVFMSSAFTVLSHLLNGIDERHRINCQGFCIQNSNQYKVLNSLSSLYCILPKIFKLNQLPTKPELDKLAIVVVSSRECDRAKSSDYKIANLMGEMIGVQRQDDGSIRLYMIGTFSDNYNSQEIHSRPDILIDEFERLYQQGFRQVLYIAKSPYSTTLNMTKTEEYKDLYFMNKAVLRHLKGQRDDLKIYPIFFDKYYAVKLQNLTASSLYIQDVAELETLVKDPSKQAVVFFNLFNGIQVGDDKNYNGVISYATLLNLYEGVLDDKDIRQGLIYDTPLKNELMQMLTLYHFSRYEAGIGKINLKLDPYENLIGFDSVGALSIFKHMTGGVEFNSLAFLTEVRKALNVEPESEET